MGRTNRCNWMVLLRCSFLGVLAFLGSQLAQGQVARKVPVQRRVKVAGVQPGPGMAVPAPPNPADAADLAGATLPTDPKLKNKLEAARDYIVQRDWGTVARTLQDLLDLPQDVFVQVTEKGADGKDVPALIGIRAAANRLLGTLPRDGLEIYRTLFGATAKKVLQDALTSGDQALFDDVMQRYLYTEAGAEAAERLGTLHLDRGRFIVAARAFEKLIQRDGVANLAPLTLFKAALAFHRAGDKDNKDKVWKELADKAADGLRLNDQNVELTELEKLLDRYRPSLLASAYDYPFFGGNESRNAQVNGGAPFLGTRDWAQPLTVEGQVKSWLYDGRGSAAQLLQDKGQAVLPGYFPIAATVQKDGKPRAILVFRSYAGISAVNLKTGKLEWLSQSGWSFDKMLRDSQKQQTLTQWIAWYKDQPNQNSKPNVLLENSTIGSLSTDNTRVYAIDDLAVPPMYHPNVNPFGGFPGGGNPIATTTVVNEAMQHNKLMAFGLVTGKVLWELGGRKPADEPERKDPRDFRDSYFLGPPLCLGGKLYFLNEKMQELRLVCFDPNRLPEKGVTAQDIHDAVVWVQTLCTAKDKILQDYRRRIHAAHIAYGEGILVCPTGAGVVLGVDVLSHSLVWAHAYRDPASAPPVNPYGEGRVIINGMIRPGQPPMDPLGGDWKNCAPLVQDGKVVFTAPDGNELRCLNLRNGAKVWGQKRQEEDLYLAGAFAGRVVIVGKKFVRAVSLEDGSREVWRVETGGMPSGRGIASDNVYYLPLREAVFQDKEKAPAVVAIDVEKGRIVAQTRSRNKEVPGNLVFFEGDVVSQNVMEVVAYPQLKVKLEKMNELIAKNPKDPVGLFERGELRLDQGNRLGAVADLREALANKPGEDMETRIRTKYFEALTELLQHEFNQGEKYLKEYEEMCRLEVDPKASSEEQAKQKDEAQRRRAGFLALYAKGRESQGRLGEAFNAYLEFGALGDKTQELLSVIDDPSVRAPADVWAQGRIAAMLARATPEQRKPLEDAILGKWVEVKDSSNLDRVRSFMTMFGLSLPIGREARLFYADQLMAQEGKAALLEAECQLLLLAGNADDPLVSARALESMARLLTRKGLLDDAAFYYRVLRDRYGQVVVRDGKTGADLHAELATDKRFIAYVEEPVLPKSRKWTVKGESGNFPRSPQQMVYTFEPEKEPLPFLQRCRVGFNYSTNQFKLQDRNTGEEKWSEPLKDANFQFFLQFLNNNPNQSGLRLAYQNVGHLIVLSLGPSVVVGLDPINQKVLWQKNLFGSQQPTGGVANQRIDSADNALEILYQDGSLIRIGGQSIPAAASYVCLQTRDGLLALEPLTGRTLWTRSDIPARCRIFGDDQHVFLVEMDRNNQPANTRVFRAQDGATVLVPNFAAPYQRRQRVLGQLLLVSDTDTPTGALTLRLYDILAGKDVWSKTFPANSVVLRSEERDLAGVVTPEGRATVFNLRTQKEVLVGVIDPRHLEKVQQAYVLADPQLFYVVLHAQDGNVNPFLWSSLQPDSGLRSIPVNGSVYAFDRANSKLKWVISDLQSQQLVLEQWKELPVLLFTSRYQRRDRGGFSPQTVGLECYEKSSGKTKFRQPSLGQHIQNFYALVNDIRGGKIELIGTNYKLTCTLDEKTPLSDRGGRNEGKGISSLSPFSEGVNEKVILPGAGIEIPAAIPVDPVLRDPPKK